MVKDIEDEYVDEKGQTATDWNDPQRYEQYMEGFFDYKERMINPASTHITIAQRKKMSNFITGIFELINRDLQLGNLDKNTYKLVYGHFHVGIELMRLGVFESGIIFIQKGFTLLTMSNSIGGMQRKLEATNISVRKMQHESGSQGGQSSWKKIRPGKNK